MSIRLDEHGNAVTEPFKSIKEVLHWIPNKFACCSSSHVRTKVHTVTSSSLSDVSGKLRTRPTRPQVLICHDMCGGYLEDRFCHGCPKVSAYKFYHWQFIDIFIYFSHNFVTIPPIGWIKAAKKHGVTVLGTVITEWEDGADICKELLKSEETTDHFTTKLAHLALFHGFDGWLINIENKVESDQVSQLQKFVRQLTVKCHHLLGVSKVLWYDSVISTGELKWQDELNSLNKMFFTVADGIFLNYNVTEDKLSQSKQMASVCDRELDIFVGVDIFGRGTLGGGGFNTIEAVKMIRKHDLSCALFAPGWVYEHLGPDRFDAQELTFWGILSETLTPRPVQVPFATSFCRGYGDRYYIQGQVVSDSPWYNLSLQQLQPSFTHSQFVSYTVSKIPQNEDPEEESQDEKQKEKFSIKVESYEKHFACPDMVFDLNVGYFGGGSLRLTARMVESKPVLFRMFLLQVLPDTSLDISVTWSIPPDGAGLCGIVLSTGKVGSPTVICTETDLCARHREMIPKILLRPEDSSGKDFMSASVHFVTGCRTNNIFTKDGEWITCFFHVDKSYLSREGNAELIISAILIPSLEFKVEDEPNKQMCAHIGYLQVAPHLTDLAPVQKDVCVGNFKCLEVKVRSLLSKENVDSIIVHPFFCSDNGHCINMRKQPEELQDAVKKIKMDVSKSHQENSYLMMRDTPSEHNNPLPASKHTIDLTSIATAVEVTSAVEATSTDTEYTLYVLKWEPLVDNVHVYLLYNYNESGVKTFIGHAVEAWFVWKQTCEANKIVMFSIQPIMSLPNLVAEEVCFCV
uniref:Cytosolic endo-beta-N-acetylglucosaminidase n=1 Tax=Arion vulgaris TaxID=1028688 RepID=A0A0B7AGW3_9EUPU